MDGRWLWSVNGENMGTLKVHWGDLKGTVEKKTAKLGTSLRHPWEEET